MPLPESLCPILSVLPQRPPFVMVDGLTHYDDEHFVTVFTVRRDNILVDDGVLSASGVLENIAQTCAAGVGYAARQDNGVVKVGVIGAMQDVVIHSLPAVGAMLRTTVTVCEKVFDMVLADATVVALATDGGTAPVAEGRLKIALTDKEV